MIKTLMIVGWLACSVAAYELFKWDLCRDGKLWNTQDRAFVLVMSATGPWALAAAAIIVALDATPPRSPASW